MKLHTHFLLYFLAAFLFICCTKKPGLQSSARAVMEDRTNSICSEPIQIFLVRHAEKSTNDPKDPDLSKAGFERAEKLMFQLAEADIKTIYATKYKRTQQTAQPLADKLGIEIKIYDTDLVDIIDLVKNAKEGNVMIAGHSNTTPKLVNKLLGQERYEKLDESVYHKLFMMSKCGEHFGATVLQY